MPSSLHTEYSAGVTREDAQSVSAAAPLGNVFFDSKHAPMAVVIYVEYLSRMPLHVQYYRVQKDRRASSMVVKSKRLLKLLQRSPHL